jgi:hypothetical protein
MYTYDFTRTNISPAITFGFDLCANLKNLLFPFLVWVQLRVDVRLFDGHPLSTSVVPNETVFVQLTGANQVGQGVDVHRIVGGGAVDLLVVVESGHFLSFLLHWKRLGAGTVYILIYGN